jgi:hypothetical protein
MCGRGLSVLGCGKVVAAVGDAAGGFAVWLEAAIEVVVSYNALLIQAGLLTVAAACTCRVVAGDARGARELRGLGLGGHGELRSGATAMSTPHSTITLQRFGMERSTT